MTIGSHTNLASTGLDMSAQVTIGDYCSIGPYVQMHTRHDHACIEYPELVSTKQFKHYPQTRSREKITIGNDVWIGRNVVILGGVTIGDGAILGSFAVVSKDVPPYAIVVGSPAIIKRYRFTYYQIEQLSKIKWWEWSDEKMEANKEDFRNIDGFIAKHSL